jgi:UDP-N-acetylmuramoyl-tripeptide--D-alanyl-D-alanine ligase
MNYSLQEIAKITNGKLIGENTIISSIHFDSRQIQMGAIFLPIKAERDGHDFIQAAIQNGAVATFTDHEISNLSIPQIVVNNNQTAFWQLAKNYLNKINPTKIVVSGSNGKTTTKDLISAVLKTKFNVHNTVGSFNNELGVPLTILQMPEKTQFAVLELGMDRPGQLHDLSNLINPDFAVLTMIGEAHIEFFKTRDKIADAKMEIIDGMTTDGTLLINGDEPLLIERATNPITFGKSDTNKFQTSNIKQTSNGLEFKVNSKPFNVRLLGDFNAVNTTSAIAIGEIFKLSNQEIQQGLNELSLTENRLSILEGKNGEKIISDVYNSNPTAAVKSVEILSEFPTEKNRYIVLGDMLELGEQSLELHKTLIKPINESNIDGVYLVGETFNQIASEITKPTLTYDKTQLELLAENLNSKLQNGDTVLLKASHGIHLDKVLENLIH